MATDDPDELPIAPLPPHERSWRHPSELARAERAVASVPPPPLDRIVAGIALGIAVALSIVLMVLVLPRTGGREDLPVAFKSPPTTLADRGSHAALGVASLDRLGRTYLLPVGILPVDLFSPERRPLIAGDLFVSTSHALDVDQTVSLPTQAGSLIPLEVTFHDDRSGLSLLRSSLPIRTPRAAIEVAPRPITAAGTTMVLHGRTEHRVKVGLRIASAAAESFVPVDVDDVTKNFVDAAPVTDIDGRLAGLFVHRDGAVGVVPVSAIVSFVERALQEPG